MTWARKTITFWLGAAMLSLVVGSSDFREDDLECEQAIAHLVTCCPDFPAESVKCEYSEGCGSETETALSIAESQCIEAQSCEAVRANGLCEKVKGLVSPVLVQDDAGTPFHPTATNHPPVCQ